MKLMALKDQTDNLLSKENAKDAAMFGAEFIPGVGEALAIKRTSDALDKKDYLGAGIEATAGLMGLIPGIGDLAGKGLRVATKKFRKADVEEAEKLIADPKKIDEWRSSNKLPESQRQKNIPEAQQAAEDLFQNKIKSKEARKQIKDAFPEPKLYTSETMPEMPTVTDVVGSMGKKSEKGILGVRGFDLEPGQRVGARLDIPAYNEYDKWVVSIHDGKSRNGSVVGYGQAIRLKNIEFGSDPKVALDIAKGKRVAKTTGEEKPMGKATIARVFGDYVPEDPYELQMFAKKVLADKDSGWTQVGMNPYRGSYFYDKATGTPVTRADEVIQVGPLVLAKNVTKPKMSELKEMFNTPAARTADGKIRVFSEGGAVPMKEQMSMFDEGGLMQEGGTVDPVSGNNVPTGSLQEEVRDDIPAQLSEGEFVMPADVVRYHGLDKMMALRDEAKMGLQRMENMGQMGNADEATIPDGIPFNLNDLDLEDNDNSLEMQVGGFVQQPFGMTQAAGTPFQYQQSAFANYTPQVSSVPAAAPAPYQAPVQQATPTMQPGTLPTFSQVVSPTMVTYVNDAGHELQIPVDADGNPLIPVPAGYKKKPDTPTDTTPDPTITPVSAPAIQQQDGNDDAPPSPATPKTDQFGREEDPAITTIKETKPFQEIENKIDPRGTFEKIKDDFLGAIGASTTSAEYDKALDLLAKDVAFAESDPEKQEQMLNSIKDMVDSSTRTELGMDLAPVTTGTTADLLAKIKESRKTSPETTRVETTQVTTDPAATVSEAATLSQDTISNIPSSGPEFEARVSRKFSELFNASPDTPIDTLLKAAKEDALFDVSVERQAAAGTLAANLQAAGSQPIDEAALKKEARAKFGLTSEPTTTRKTTTGPTGVNLGRGEDMPISARIEKSKQSAQSKLDAAKKADKKQYSRDIRSGKYDDTFAQLDKARRDDNTQRNSKPNRAGVNLSEKVGKENAAKINDRQGTATNVSGNGTISYSSDHDWSKPTQTNVNTATSSKGQAIKEDRDEGGTGKIVCTEMYRQTQLDDWKEAIKIWGVHQKKYLTPYHEKGYHWLFKPWVRGMRKSIVLTSIGAYLAKARTQHLKHILTHGKAKDDIVGNMWCKIVHPITYITGRMLLWKK